MDFSVNKMCLKINLTYIACFCYYTSSYKITSSTGIKPHVSLREGGVTSNPAHCSIGRGLAKWVASSFPLLPRFHDHCVATDRRTTPARERAFETRAFRAAP